MDYEFVPGRDDFPPDEITMLRQQLADVEESNKAVEKVLDNVDYRDTYADGVWYLKQQLAAALAACEERAKALRWYMPMMPIEHQYRINDILAIKPDASALKARDEALIEKCAEVCEEHQGSAETCAAAIRELKGTL